MKDTSLVFSDLKYTLEDLDSNRGSPVKEGHWK